MSKDDWSLLLAGFLKGLALLVFLFAMFAIFQLVIFRELN